MASHDIIVVGASAGGVESVRALARGLPADLAAAVFVVVHISPESPGVLPTVLDMAGPLPAAAAREGEPIRAGRIYVAPPDRHLLVEPGRVHVVRGPKENRCRPAVDPLFRSAALAYGARVVGVVLSGALDDGTAGLAAIKERGGLAIVQDPDEAAFPGMPASALANVEVDHRLRLAEIPAVLARLASEPAGRAAAPTDVLVTEAAMESGEPRDMNEIGRPSVFGCPDCGGVLWEVDDPQLLRFRCRVGHAYSSETLMAVQEDGIEAALWAAARALEENAGLKRRVADRFRNGNNESLVGKLEGQASHAEQHADSLRRLLVSLQDLTEPKAEAEPAPDLTKP